MLKHSDRLSLAFAFILTASLAPAAEKRAGQEECEVDSHETPEYFRARYQWYLDTYGEGGVFNPEVRLEHLRTAYAQYRADVLARKRLKSAPVDAAPFRFVGPVNGAGRATALEPHPTDPNILYVGAAGGGCWKSTNGGDSWRVLTDGLADLSVGAVAVAPTNPSLVYLGTGEGGYAQDFIPGIGVFKSTDAGETWQLPATVIAPLVYRLSVDPRDANTVLAFTNNGVQRTTDGGATWRRTSDTAWADAAEAARDATNPDIVHATFWSFGGDLGKYAKSTDGGVTWTEKTSGLPSDPKARMGLALSADGRSVYALVCGPRTTNFPQVGLWRSTDAGETWTKAALRTASGTAIDVLGGQGWYDNVVAVDPDDPRRILLGGVSLYRSTDGGDTLTNVGSTDGVHVDHHQLLFKKYDTATKHAWSANDGGVWRSTDGGVRWTDRNRGLATRQYYSVAIDPTRPNVVYAGSQDNGSDRIDTVSGEAVHVLGSDGFETAVDPDNPGTVYGTSQYNSLVRSTRDGEVGTYFYIAQTWAGRRNASTGPDGATRPFLSWLTLDPNGPKTVYSSTYRIWRSDDTGDNWSPLASTGFDVNRSAIALAVAKGNPDRLLVAQTNQIFVSSDRGLSFTPSTAGLPVATTYRNVEIDPSNPDTFFVCRASSNATVPGRVFKSVDAGRSWTRSDSGLPDFGVEAIRVDPGDSRTVYAGTLVGLYRSTNGGTNWNRWGDGLPAAAIHEVRVAADGSRIALATHGRGVWVANALNPNRPPTARIDSPAAPVAIRSGETVTFSGSAIDPDNDALTYRWDLGDGMTASGAAPGAFVYRTPGVYKVTLVAEDSRGGRGGAIQTVTVAAPNDRCRDAIPISLIPDTVVVSRSGNAGTFDDPTDPQPPIRTTRPEGAGTRTCLTRTGNSPADETYSNSVWFTFTPPADGTVDLDTFYTPGDTFMALYRGTCEDLGVAIDCNDDGGDVSGGPSALSTASVTAGATYRVLVGTWASASRQRGGPVDGLRVRALFKPSAVEVPSPGTTAILPVVLDAYGRNGARFQSDLTLLNRGSEPLAVALTYGGSVGIGEASATVTLPAGAQVRAADALAELRRVGLGVPKTTPGSSQVGSLTALVTQGDPSALVLASRTATQNPNAAVGGSFGLHTTGTSFADAADDGTVYVYGLRQTDADRANLALVHVRAPRARTAGTAEKAIVLNVDVFDAAGAAAPRSPLTVALQPGEWTQITEVLGAAGLPAGSADGGYARIRRMSGTGRFVAYGVVNDQKTSDGSFLPMTKAGEMTAGDALLVPVVLRTGGLNGSFYTSELVLANRSSKAAVATLRLTLALGDAPLGTTKTVELPAGAQRVLPDIFSSFGTGGGGSVRVTFEGLGAIDDVYAGVRTSTANPDAAQGGAFGVVNPAVPTAALASSATVPALRQDATVRSNLAVVATGPITVTARLRSAVDGTPIGNPLTQTLSAGQFFQWSGVFNAAGIPAGGEAYAVITRTQGDAGFYAYGVLNDARTSDGSVVGMVK